VSPSIADQPLVKRWPNAYMSLSAAKRPAPADRERISGNSLNDYISDGSLNDYISDGSLNNSTSDGSSKGLNG
jgi:hypothetical protein